jgi:putative two-component system response regulator
MPGSGERVLLVDDESAMRDVCRLNLEIEGFDVLEAAEGEQALALALRERPDLVLLDVMLPVMNGYDVARRLQANPATARIPVVFMTALATGDDRKRGFEAGGVGYIVKPFDPVSLGENIRQTLGRLERGEREELRQELLLERT